jgi:hypothetical protein
MPYQFIHVEAYGRRGARRKESAERNPSMFGIRDEMIRAPHACSHVSAPQSPNLLFGLQPVEAFSIAAERAERAIDKLDRKLSMTALVVGVGVASWPELAAEVSRDPKAHSRYFQWREETVSWLQRQWGDKLKCVVEHMDEERPHLHFVIVPELDEDGGLRIDSIHQGRRAAAECKAAGGNPREQKKAFEKRMRRFQDDYYNDVSVRFGQTRIGPQRQRLSRKQWKEQELQAEALARAHANLREQASQVKAKAQEYAAKRAVEINATGQAKIEEARQREKEVKRKAASYITKQGERIRELNKMISENQAAFAAQQEELDFCRRLLKEHGLLPDLAFL